MTELWAFFEFLKMLCQLDEEQQQDE